MKAPKSLLKLHRAARPETAQARQLSVNYPSAVAKTLGFYALILAALEAQAESSLSLRSDAVRPELGLDPPRKSVWENGIGEGFRADAQSIGIGAGALYGIATFGSQQAHDLALVDLCYGHMLGGMRGEGHWYQGNPEIRLEVFTGAQFSPERQWLVGLAPHLRYNFATGTRLVPFFDMGAGATATGIGPPDLSGTFEFNLQASVGVQWFIKDNVAITLESRYVHWSCAGLHRPNLGLNGVSGMLGIAFFF